MITQQAAVDLARQCGALVESWMTNPPKPGLFYMTPDQLQAFANAAVKLAQSNNEDKTP